MTRRPAFVHILLFLGSHAVVMTGGALLVPSQVLRSPSSSSSAAPHANQRSELHCDGSLIGRDRAAPSRNRPQRATADPTAAALAPSQARPGGWHGVRPPPGRRWRGGPAIAMAMERGSDVGTASEREDEGGDEVVFRPQNDVNGSNGVAAVAHRSVVNGGGENNESSATAKKSKGNRKAKRLRMTGNIPDVYWRAIPMDHLRHHPYFEPLPHPDTITELRSLEEVRLFRQESWQWDALHSGRCTTSQATAALGLLEPRAGKVLGVPRSLQKGAGGAYRRLRMPALRTLEEMNRVLCTGEGNGPQEKEILGAPVWDTRTGDGGKVTRPVYFAATYLPRMKKSDLNRRRELIRNCYLDESSRWIARMQWGNAQEPTAILTALNYFSRKFPGSKIREVGMCGAGLELNTTNTSTGLIVGATPDAVIHYPDGTLEALEVKNHCPFVPANWGARRRVKQDVKGGDSNDMFRIRESPIQVDVPAAYVPQLMLEMLSLGPHCRSAVMVRQTATRGAVILRLQRDDEWIDEMIYWLNRFMDQFVNAEVPPPANFFWDNQGQFGGGERYQAFVNRTKEISESAELVCHVPHGEIQRVVSMRRFQIPLFLD